MRDPVDERIDLVTTGCKHELGSCARLFDDRAAALSETLRRADAEAADESAARPASVALRVPSIEFSLLCPPRTHRDHRLHLEARREDLRLLHIRREPDEI